MKLNNDDYTNTMLTNSKNVGSDFADALIIAIEKFNNIQYTFSYQAIDNDKFIFCDITIPFKDNLYIIFKVEKIITFYTDKLCNNEISWLQIYDILVKYCYFDVLQNLEDLLNFKTKNLF